MRRKVACTLAALLAATALGTLAACGTKDGGGQVGKDGFTYYSLLSAKGAEEIGADQTVSYDINEDITGKEYVRICLKTDVHLLGAFVYQNIENNEEIVEEFFIEQSNGTDVVEFKQFLDSYRYNGVGQVAQKDGTKFVGSHIFGKKLKSIRFTNKSMKAGKMQLESLSVADRTFPDYEREIYVEKDNLKVGADLAVGGTLTYLERTSYNGQTIDEVVLEDGTVYIGVDAKSKPGAKLYSSKVNLINTFDQGRQIQQSYYANVGSNIADTHDKMAALGLYEEGRLDESVEKPYKGYGDNGYNRALCDTADRDGYFWPYNPVQGGDVATNSSQIIDFSVSKNEIYIKVRAMDWAKGRRADKPLYGTVDGGVTTKSYMENWYTIQNGTLFVKNRFIDWNGFTNMESVDKHSNELPAVYISHPLHNYVVYQGKQPWTNGELFYKGDLGAWTEAPQNDNQHLEDWFAWVNDDEMEDLGGFGVGMYIPNIITFHSGRSNASTHISLGINKDAFESPCALDYRFNKAPATYRYMSCYTRNTSYTAPVVSWRMRTYQPMTYGYAVVVDYVKAMRQQFKDIALNEMINNETLHDWD